jgi:hypothetical protein
MGHDRNIIQDNALLDDKTMEIGCIIIIPNMHKWLDE